jgi:hypothetical protein
MTVTPFLASQQNHLDSLELRWIVQGPLGVEIRDWFAPFPATMEAREDTYLLRPRLPGLSLKLRDGLALDVKSYLGSPGLLTLPSHGEGRLEYWRKSSFPCNTRSEVHALAEGWVTVHKMRQSVWFPLPAGQDPRLAPAPPDTGCMVELTEADVGGQKWWTVGLEATGAAESLHAALRHAVTTLFAHPPPTRTGFSLDNSWSYAEWLTLQAEWLILQGADRAEARLRPGR